jgi:hypothetical protein
MEMVRQERPGEALGVRLSQKQMDTLDKILSVNVVNKDVAALDAANYDMLKQPGDIDTCSTWHQNFNNLQG